MTEMQTAEKRIEPLLKASDVARILNISRTQAYRLMHGELPVIRCGPGTLRVRLCDLDNYVNSHIGIEEPINQ